MLPHSTPRRATLTLAPTSALAPALPPALALAALIAVSYTVPSAWAIGLGDVKKKAEQKAKEKLEEKTKTEEPGAEAEGEPEEATDGKAAASDGGDTSSISKVSTKFDFVPGDKVLFSDDLSADESGEFPARWKLLEGNLEVAEFEGRKWIHLAGDRGRIEMKLPGPLPERWTLEFDLHSEAPACVLEMHAHAAESLVDIWWVAFGPHGNDVSYMFNQRESLTTLPAGDMSGHHHVAFMADGRKLKVYFDRERVVNEPEVEWEDAPINLTFRMRAPDANPLITNVRFAEKTVPPPDLLAVPFVTHGIYFDSGADRVRPESAPVLRQIHKYLEANPAVRVRITGHTDDVGQDEANLDLSKRRAAAVREVLGSEFGIEVGRIETDGKGEGAPIAPNDTQEGRASNRRVEFEKI